MTFNPKFIGRICS